MSTYVSSRGLSYRARRRGQGQVYTCVDPVLVLPADRGLELVPRSRQVEGTAEPDERARHVEREVALEAGGLDLRLLAQPLGLEKGREQEADEEEHHAPAGGSPEEAHQKRK
jgi:hypothetical protein